MIIVRYFTQKELVEAIKRAQKKEFNRMGSLEVARSLDKFGNFPIVFEMLHQHKAGEPTDPHMRCIVMVSKEQTMIVDVDLDLYRSLNHIDYWVTSQ